MENEVEIFRAWLKKTVKIDKNPPGKELAEKLGIPAPRITQYHSGRIDDKVRTFPNIPFKIRKEILKITNTSEKEMLEIGRKELYGDESPDNPYKAHFDAMLPTITAKVKAELKQEEKEKPIKDPTSIPIIRKNQKHHDIFDQFRYPDLAEAINRDLLKLESFGDLDELDEVHDLIKKKIKKLKKRFDKEAGRKASGDDSG